MFNNISNGTAVTAVANPLAGSIALLVFLNNEDLTFPSLFTKGFPKVRVPIVLRNKDPTSFAPTKSLAKEIPNCAAFSKVGSLKQSAKSKEVPIKGV